MRNKKRFADRPFGYDNSAPTAWVTITLLVVFVALFTQTALASAYLADVHYSSDYNDAIFEAAYEKRELERERQAYLVELRKCESELNDFAEGDGGASVGPYQWQKPSLEDAVGYQMSYGEYYALATDYERIHPITYRTYFEKEESWRWENCTIKINAQRIWKL